MAAGCTAIIKPSELTPLTALALQSLALEANIPPTVLQVITADRDSTPNVGKEFCTNSAVRKVSFTGSTAVGKQLMEWSSRTVQRLSLELGGNAPFVVFDDARSSAAVYYGTDGVARRNKSKKIRLHPSRRLLNDASPGIRMP